MQLLHVKIEFLLSVFQSDVGHSDHSVDLDALELLLWKHPLEVLLVGLQLLVSLLPS
jgi:hypothetical protein